MTRQIAESGIFILPAVTEKGSPEPDRFILYSPLAGKALVADSAGVDLLVSRVAQKNNPSDDFGPVSRSLAALLPPPEQAADILRPCSSPKEYRKLSIIPTYKCNFSCSYCYSATGRAGADLLPEKLIPALDFFIDYERTQGGGLSIFITGGGEPLMAWDITKKAVTYAAAKARSSDLPLQIMLISNGSLLDKEKIAFISSNNIFLSISFDMLEEQQNNHRGNYKTVVNNIELLLNHGVIPSLSSTIIPKYVSKIPEMIRNVHSVFPEIKKINIDPVMIPHNELSQCAEIRSFFTEYTRCFFDVKHWAVQHGISLTCTTEKLLQRLATRYCPGKLCLTPQGTFSICHCVTSPMEQGYADCQYGSIDERSGVHFTQEAFSRLLARNVSAYPECADCFARWHCAGFCMTQRAMASQETRGVLCEFVQFFLTRALMDKLSSVTEESGP